MKRCLLLLLFIFLGLLSSCKDKKASKERENLPKKTAVVERGDIFLEVTATGAIKPQVGAQVKVGARISGKVERLLVRQGDFVRKGQLIAVIEHQDLKNQVERFEYELKQAISQLSKAEQTYPEKILAQRKIVSAIFAELEQLDRDKRRYENLLNEGLISRKELEKIDTERTIKLHQLEAERANLRALEFEYQREIERLRAQVESIKRQLEDAKIRLSYAFVYSPIDGFVSEVTTQQGETVVAGLNAPTFITVIDLKRLEVHCYIDETDIGKIKPGMEAHFKVDSYPDKTFKARVRTIYPGAIIKNNVVFYNAVLDILTPYEDYLRPEMTAQVTIIAGKKENVIIVPSNSVKIDPQGRHFVMVKKDDKWEKRIVKVGWESRGKIEIIEGLEVGEVVGVW